MIWEVAGKIKTKQAIYLFSCQEKYCFQKESEIDAHRKGRREYVKKCGRVSLWLEI